MNNKQSMKLYTEEEIRKFLSEKYDEGLSIDELIVILTPIELPSDEEIDKEADSFFALESYNQTFTRGAKWMRDKIGGNNEQQ